MTAFVGPSEAGKTTMAMLIARFWDDRMIIVVTEKVRDYMRADKTALLIERNRQRAVA